MPQEFSVGNTAYEYEVFKVSEIKDVVNDDHTMVLTTNDDRQLRLVNEVWWSTGDYFFAQAIVTDWNRRNKRKPNDLTSAFVSSDSLPGMKVIANVPDISHLEGVVMRTNGGHMILIQEDVDIHW